MREGDWWCTTEVVTTTTSPGDGRAGGSDGVRMGLSRETSEVCHEGPPAHTRHNRGGPVSKEGSIDFRSLCSYQQRR